jgi:uncharacterized oxidoreductase
MKTTGRKVLIVGGGSGIGLALAGRLSASNRIAVAGRDRTTLDAAVMDVPALVACELDVTDESGARSAIDHVVGALGGLDLLVQSAGVMQPYAIEDLRAAELGERDMQVNFLGAARLVRLALPHLRREAEPGIVLISSVVAIAPAPGYAVYSASKAAVHSLVRSIRRELEPAIRVFEVLPTWVDTGPASRLSVPKLAPAEVADTIVRALRADRYDVFVGRARAVSLINRLSPGLAEALVARASRSS